MHTHIVYSARNNRHHRHHHRAQLDRGWVVYRMGRKAYRRVVYFIFTFLSNLPIVQLPSYFLYFHTAHIKICICNKYIMFIICATWYNYYYYYGAA